MNLDESMQMSKIGKLYVFEGPDGTGKTALAKSFSKYLTSIGRKNSYFSFPGNCSGSLGKLIYEIHHDIINIGISSINATSLQLLHVASHIDAIESKILPELLAGNSIVLDRFWWSTMVYGHVYGANINSLNKLVEIEKIHWSDVQPSCVFYLKRKSSLKPTSVKNWDELVEAYEELVQHEYKFSRIEHISNEYSLEDALSQIIKIYSNHVKGKP
jgi:thymidylate kinase